VNVLDWNMDIQKAIALGHGSRNGPTELEQAPARAPAPELERMGTACHRRASACTASCEPLRLGGRPDPERGVAWGLKGRMRLRSARLRSRDTNVTRHQF